MLALLGPLALLGQQEALLAHYPQFRQLYNPAYAGSRGFYQLDALYRNQWTGFEGAPKTFVFSGHAGFGDRKHGAGVVLANENLGPYRQLAFLANYAFRIKLHFGPAKIAYLGLGVQAGMLNHAFDGTNLDLLDPDDPVLPGTVNGTVVPDVGAGAVLYTHRWFVEAAVTHLAGQKLNFNGGGEARLERHYIGGGGFDLPTSKYNKNFVLSPAIRVQYAQTFPVQVHATLRATVMEKVYGGATYRIREGFAFQVGAFPIDNLHVGYALDLTSNSLGRQAGLTHNIAVGYGFGNPRQKVLTPIFF